MALPTLIEASDLTPLLPGATDTAKVAYSIRAASAYIRSYTRVDWVTDDDKLDPDLPDAISIVAINLALRVYNSPDDTVSQEWAGPFSRTMSSGMWLSKSDREMLEPFRDYVKNASLTPESALPPMGAATYLATVGRSDADPIELNWAEAP